MLDYVINGVAFLLPQSCTGSAIQVQLLRDFSTDQRLKGWLSFHMFPFERARLRARNVKVDDPLMRQHSIGMDRQRGRELWCTIRHGFSHGVQILACSFASTMKNGEQRVGDAHGAVRSFALSRPPAPAEELVNKVHDYCTDIQFTGPRVLTGALNVPYHSSQRVPDATTGFANG